MRPVYAPYLPIGREAVRMETTVTFADIGTSSDAFVVIRTYDDSLALGFGVATNGDLDLQVTREDARRIAEAILAAVESA